MHGNRRLIHLRMPQERRLDFADLDAMTVQLDLPIIPAEKLELALVIPAHAIARSIHAFPGRRERVRQKACSGEARAPDIPSGQGSPGDVQLADDARRDRPEVLIEHMQSRVGDRFADRNARSTLIVAETGADGGLGRPIGVDEAPLAGPLPRKRRRAGLACYDQPCQTRTLELAQRRQYGRWQGRNGDPFPGEQCCETVPSLIRICGQHAQSCTVAQRQSHLPHRSVEGMTRKLQHPILWSQVECTRLGHREICQCAMFQQHALGLARGARSEDHIGQIAVRHCDLRRVGGAPRQLGRNLLQAYDLSVAGRQRPSERTVRESQRYVRLLHHELQARARTIRVQRQERAPRLEYRQYSDHRLCRALQVQPDDDLGADATIYQVVRQAVAALLQLPVSEAVRTARHCQRRGSGRCPFGKQTVHVTQV